MHSKKYHEIVRIRASEKEIEKEYNELKKQLYEDDRFNSDLETVKMFTEWLHNLNNSGRNSSPSLSTFYKQKQSVEKLRVSPELLLKPTMKNMRVKGVSRYFAENKK